MTKPLSRPWTRRPKEPANWYARFDAYLSLGPARSLESAFRTQGSGTFLPSAVVASAVGFGDATVSFNSGQDMGLVVTGIAVQIGDEIMSLIDIDSTCVGTVTDCSGVQATLPKLCWLPDRRRMPCLGRGRQLHRDRRRVCLGEWCREASPLDPPAPDEEDRQLTVRQGRLVPSWASSIKVVPVTGGPAAR